MNDPCLTNDCVDKKAVRNYGCFKWLVLLLLLALIPLLFYLQSDTGRVATAAQAPDIPVVAVATEVSEAMIAPLTLNPPQLGELALAAETGVLAVDPLTLTGRGEPGTTVEIRQSGSLIGNALVGSDGTWTFEQELNLASGRYDFDAQMVGSDGSVLDQSRTAVVIPEMAAPAGAALSFDPPQLGDFGPAAGAAGLVTGPLTLTGAGEPGADIEIWQGDRLFGQTSAGNNGDWSFEEQVILAPGRYTLQARMVGSDGSRLDQLDAVVIIPKVALPRPTLILSGGETEQDELLLSGTAAPSSEVQIVANNEVVDTVTADAAGSWRSTLRLPASTYDILARTVLDPASTEALDSNSQTATVHVARPVILGTNSGDTGEPQPGFYGRGRPSTVLEILEDDVPIGTVNVLPDGTWACNCTLAPGDHALVIREAGNSNTAGEPVTLSIANRAPPFEVPRVAPDPNRPKFSCPDGPPPFGEIQGNLYVVATCETMGLIANRLGSSLEDLTAHNPQVPDPNRIYGGQLLNIPANASCSDINN